MKTLKAILKTHNKVITQLEKLATHNESAIEGNTAQIKKLQESNLELISEAQASRSIASNFRKLISEEVGE